MMIKTEGALTPSMLAYLQRGISSARDRGAVALIFQINTPGGSVDLMNKMVEEIRGSSVPVVVYVAPRGAIAGSAGTLITLAGHIAVMAPETSIGAASPVGAQGEDIGATMESKVKEILKATARNLTTRRGSKAVELAEATIESAKAASAQEALDAGLIDFIATSTDDLLRQLDGRTVEVEGRTFQVRTTGAALVEVPASFIEQLLQLLTNPNLVFLLLAIGVQAILIELSSPGGWVAGFIGVVCLLLATYGLGVLPVNWFGILFIVLAFILFILELKTPTVGALTAAGIGSFIVGALVLFNSPGVPTFQRVSIPLVVGVSVVTGLSFLVVISIALRAQRTPIKAGRETLVGQIGTVRSDLSPVGTVQVGGELWTAEHAEGVPIKKGTKVMVESVQGIRVKVRPSS
jgi:membrane-bound serine protease (ClpP class)